MFQYVGACFIQQLSLFLELLLKLWLGVLDDCHLLHQVHLSQLQCDFRFALDRLEDYCVFYPFKVCLCDGT